MEILEFKESVHAIYTKPDINSPALVINPTNTVSIILSTKCLPNNKYSSCDQQRKTPECILDYRLWHDQ